MTALGWIVEKYLFLPHCFHIKLPHTEITLSHHKHTHTFMTQFSSRYSKCVLSAASFSIVEILW